MVEHGSTMTTVFPDGRGPVAFGFPECPAQQAGVIAKDEIQAGWIGSRLDDLCTRRSLTAFPGSIPDDMQPSRRRLRK